MTVAQLREILSRYPDELPVMFSYDDLSRCEFRPYIAVENSNGLEVNDDETDTSKDFLVFTLD